MITVKTRGGGSSYGFPFLGPMSHPLSVLADISTLTTDEVDANGELKPGTPLKVNGSKCDSTANEYVFGVVIEPTKIVDANPTNVSLAADARIGAYCVEVENFESIHAHSACARIERAGR